MQTSFIKNQQFLQSIHFKKRSKKLNNSVWNYPVNDLIVKLSIDGIFTFVSPVSSLLLGYSPDEMIGKPAAQFIHHDDVERLIIFLQELNSKPIKNVNETQFVEKFRFIKKDGTSVWMEVVISIIFHHITKHPIEFVGIMKSIIGNKKHEEMLLQNEKLSVVGQLAAGIAHEIRNPLTSLKGFIQLMKSDNGCKKQYLEIMESEIERIDSISKELMILAKPNKNQYQVTDLEPILLDCISLLEGEAFYKRIDLKIDIEERLFPIYCDEQKIKQVFINIIKNAIESMDKPGKITIELKEKNNQAVISITDEGCGIPKEYISHLGKPFFTTKSNGNGLGLMMCYKIIEEHNGTISVQSEPGIGTTFYIYLPLNYDHH